MIEISPSFGLSLLIFCLFLYKKSLDDSREERQLNVLKEIKDELKQMNAEFAIQRRYDRELEDK